MPSTNATSTNWLFNVDAEGGVMDRVLEHLQLKHYDASGLLVRTSSALGNTRNLVKAALGEEPVLALSVTEDHVTPDELKLIADQLPPGSVLHVFMRHYVDPKSENIIARLVPSENQDQFVLKVAGHVHRLITSQPRGSRLNGGSSPLEFPDKFRRFSTLDGYQPVLDERHTIRVDADSVPYELFSDLRSGSDKLVVFGQDAINRKANPLPHFYRWSWLGSLDASALILNDPSLYAADDLLAGWWVGQQSRDFVKEAVGLIAKAAGALGIRNEDVTFFGASAGGFSSLAMAACLPGSRAIVDIPQVSLRTYGAKVASDASIRAGLGFENAEAVPAEYLHRINIVDRFVAEQCVPDFLYLQNNRDHTHVGAQMGPFLAGVGELMASHAWAHSQFTVETYSAWNLLKGGHFPLSRDVAIQRINEYIRTPRDRIMQPLQPLGNHDADAPSSGLTANDRTLDPVTG